MKTGFLFSLIACLYFWSHTDGCWMLPTISVAGGAPLWGEQITPFNCWRSPQSVCSTTLLTSKFFILCCHIIFILVLVDFHGTFNNNITVLLPETLTLYYAYVTIRFLGYARVFTITFFSSIDIATLVLVYLRIGLPFPFGLNKPQAIFCRGNVISTSTMLKVSENGTTTCYSYSSFGFVSCYPSDCNFIFRMCVSSELCHSPTPYKSCYLDI